MYSLTDGQIDRKMVGQMDTHMEAGGEKCRVIRRWIKVKMGRQKVRKTHSRKQIRPNKNKRQKGFDCFEGNKCLQLLYVLQ